MPAPFVGDTEFTYVMEAPDGSRDDATVTVRVTPTGEPKSKVDVKPGSRIKVDDGEVAITSKGTLVGERSLPPNWLPPKKVPV